MNLQSSSVFALMWNLCRDSLPYEVLDDFDDFLKNCNIPSMGPHYNKKIPGNYRTGSYTINIGNEAIIFNDAVLAPPTGFCGKNYSR